MIRDKKAAKIAFWASMARLVSVCLGSGMGSLIYQSVGPGARNWYVAALLGTIAIGLMIYSEYERETARTNTSGEPSALAKAKLSQESEGEPAPKYLKWVSKDGKWELK